MPLAETLRRTVWVAAGEVTNGLHIYKPPKPYRWSWRTASTFGEMQAFGPSYVDHRVASAPNRDLEDIKPFDRVWMDVPPPEVHDQLAASADFYVVGVNKTAGQHGTVILKRTGAHDA